MHFYKKFKPIAINEQGVRRLTRCGLRSATLEVNMSLTDPITLKEPWNAISKGKPPRLQELMEYALSSIHQYGM